MKKIIVTIFLLISANVFSIEKFECVYSDVVLNFSINNREPLNVEVFKKQTKIMNCQMDITSIENNPNAESSLELYRLSKKDCQNIYDKEAKKYEFVKNGFLKRMKGDKTISAYFLKNKQPLICNKLKK